MYLVFTVVALMICSSCYMPRTAGNSGKVPPGQIKKRTGSKSAKPYAPGQRKKNKYDKITFEPFLGMTLLIDPFKA